MYKGRLFFSSREFKEISIKMVVARYISFSLQTQFCKVLMIKSWFLTFLVSTSKNVPDNFTKNVAASPKLLLIIWKQTFLQGIQYAFVRPKWCIIGASALFQEKRQHLTIFPLEYVAVFLQKNAENWSFKKMRVNFSQGILVHCRFVAENRYFSKLFCKAFPNKSTLVSKVLFAEEEKKDAL